MHAGRGDQAGRDSSRLIDVAGSLFGLALCAPFFVVVAYLIRRNSPGPVFYRARRVGKGGRPLLVFKFRTMVVDADSKGPGITTAGDSRITKIGGFLRRWKIDEVPQLINVLMGNMSLVGPRPEDPRYVELYTPEQRRVLDVRPGMTSLAFFEYPDEESVLVGDDWEKVYVERVLPEKLTIDLGYLERRNAWTDVVLILKTIWSIMPIRRV
jgi:lipopolysaccharide/colanic/teichoic acid biosynthesis glycosyltransferase